MTLIAIATIHVDMDVTWEFLLSINPDASQEDTKWNFVFSPEGSDDIGKELEEMHISFTGFKRLAGIKNQDGHGHK